MDMDIDYFLIENMNRIHEQDGSFYAILFFLNTTRWLKGEVSVQEYLASIDDLCHQAKDLEAGEREKLRTFLDQLMVATFYGGKAQLFSWSWKQKDYRNASSKALHNCYAYLLYWFEEETGEPAEQMPYSEHIWDDFQLCISKGIRNRNQFWKGIMESYKRLKAANLLPPMPIIHNLISRHTKEIFIFKNRYFAYLYQGVCGITALFGVFFLCSIGKLLYNLLVLLPYNRLLLYSGSNAYSDRINEFLTLKYQLGSVFIANRECIWGMGIGFIFLMLTNLVCEAYKKRLLYSTPKKYKFDKKM